MAHHNRTPGSVRAAPVLTPDPVSMRLGINAGPCRAARRHVTLNAEGERVNPGLGKTVLIPKASRAAATNVPLTIAQSFRRRGKKATRHAARFA